MPLVRKQNRAFVSWCAKICSHKGTKARLKEFGLYGFYQIIIFLSFLNEEIFFAQQIITGNL